MQAQIAQQIPDRIPKKEAAQRLRCCGYKVYDSGMGLVIHTQKNRYVATLTFDVNNAVDGMQAQEIIWNSAVNG